VILLYDVQKRLPDIPFTPTLPVLLRQAVDRFGDDDYVVMPDQRLSFADAELASAKLAKRLLAAGVGKGTRIGIILPTGIDWVVAWLAAGRIGAYPMLFPATYRPAELRRALRMSDAALLVAAPTLLGKDYEAFLEEAIPTLAEHDASGPLSDTEVPFLRSVWIMGDTDRTWATVIDASAEAPAANISDELFEAVESEVSPADPLLVIYTSGSSAEPKAIIHTHGATIRKVQAELGICLPGSLPGRTFCAMPFFWIGGPQDLLGALHSGAAVVSQERFEVGEALELLERERCDSIVGWASVYEQLAAHPTYPDRDLSRLKLPEGQRFESSRGDPVNLGMTETFGPHANLDWFDYLVVDPETGEELPEGDEGEFWVRGFGLMAGMYKREREAVFDPDGFYHTGDRGYIENDRIWFRGRYTEMVKAGGANVAPLEVEQILLGLDGVRMAFVMGVPDPERGEVVAAVVAPDEGASLDPDTLSAQVNAQLSHYKVPVRWLIIEEGEIPWLASGKPDKRSLKERFQ
jgi:acyl-CoA synthetase (AMP-forming)/AMP-acid ligase II